MYGDNIELRSRATAAGLFAASTPDEVPAPGDTLHLRMDELGMTQAELALRTGLTPKHLSQLMNGLVPLTADVAQRLEYATGVPARWWNRLEADYRSAQTRSRQIAEAGARAQWASRMPVRHLVRAGALPAGPADNASRVSQLLSFFGVASPEAYDALWSRPAAAFRQSAAHPIDGDAVSAWLRLGEIEADRAALSGYDAAGLRATLPALTRLTAEPLLRAWPKALELLGAAGVAVVLVAEIPGARAYGASRWKAGRPVVQLSLRGKTEDVLWMTLFHELGHVLLHGRRASFVEFANEGNEQGGDGPGARDSATPEDDPESQAQTFALDHLYGDLGPEALAAVRTDDDAAELADSLGIGPGLVVARLHALGLWDRRQGARLRRRTPSTHELFSSGPFTARPRPRRRPRSPDGPDGAGSGGRP